MQMFTNLVSFVWPGEKQTANNVAQILDLIAAEINKSQSKGFFEYESGVVDWRVNTIARTIADQIPADELQKFREWQSKYNDLCEKLKAKIITPLEFAARAFQMGFSSSEIEAEATRIVQEQAQIQVAAQTDFTTHAARLAAALLNQTR